LVSDDIHRLVRVTALVGSVYKDRKTDSSTQQSQVRHGGDEPGLTIEPQIAPDPEGPIQSADRSTATVGGVDQSFSKTWFEADPSCSVTEMKKMMMANGKGGAWLPTRVLQKSGTHSTKERSFTELRFASFRARL
jgi:hypothetical protein